MTIPVYREGMLGLLGCMLPLPCERQELMHRTLMIMIKMTIGSDDTDKNDDVIDNNDEDNNNYNDDDNNSDT